MRLASAAALYISMLSPEADVTAGPLAKKTHTLCALVGWPAQARSLPSNVLLVPRGAPPSGFTASPDVIHNQLGVARNYGDLFNNT